MTGSTPHAIGDLLRAFEAGELSPVDIMDGAIRRIEALEPTINAFVVIDDRDRLRDQARRSEERWRRAESAGPLDGIPITVKDTIRAKGWPTRSGSLTTPDEPDAFDAPAVARLREAGAIVLGKTTTSEFGWKTVTDSPLTGVTRNPWNPELTPGGSSGGPAAAVASGMAAASVGTDAAGSVRIPSAFCGLVGMKATRGRIPTYPPSAIWTLGHVGPIARSVSDLARMLQVMSRPDMRDWSALPESGVDYLDAVRNRRGPAGLRVAYSPTLGHARVDPEVAAAVAGTVGMLENLGASVEEVEAPLPDAREPFRTYMSAGISHRMRHLTAAAREQLDPGLAAMVEEGARVTREQFLDAYEFQIRISREARLLHERYDVLVTPTAATAAFQVNRLAPEGCQDSWLEWSAFTYPFNLSGQPALSMCCGYTASGAPIGIQIVGPLYGEEVVLSVARALEDEGSLRTVYPPRIGNEQDQSGRR